MREGNLARNYEVSKDVNPSTVNNEASLVSQYRKAEENNDILSLIKRVEGGNFKPNEKVELGIVSNDLAEQIMTLTGINVTGFKIAIEARQIEHIIKDHGKQGKTDTSMANPSDIAKMGYTILN